MNIGYTFLHAYKWQNRFSKLFLLIHFCVLGCICGGGGTRTTVPRLPATFSEIGLSLAWNLQLASLTGQRPTALLVSTLQQGNCQGTH